MSKKGPDRLDFAPEVSRVYLLMNHLREEIDEAMNFTRKIYSKAGEESAEYLLAKEMVNSLMLSATYHVRSVIIETLRGNNLNDFDIEEIFYLYDQLNKNDSFVAGPHGGH